MNSKPNPLPDEAEESRRLTQERRALEDSLQRSQGADSSPRERKFREALNEVVMPPESDSLEELEELRTALRQFAKDAGISPDVIGEFVAEAMDLILHIERKRV